MGSHPSPPAIQVLYAPLSRPRRGGTAAGERTMHKTWDIRGKLERAQTVTKIRVKRRQSLRNGGGDLTPQWQPRPPRPLPRALALRGPVLLGLVLLGLVLLGEVRRPPPARPDPRRPRPTRVGEAKTGPRPGPLNCIVRSGNLDSLHPKTDELQLRNRALPCPALLTHKF